MTPEREDEIADGIGRKPTVTEIEELMQGQLQFGSEQTYTYYGKNEAMFQYWLGYQAACRVAVNLLSNRRGR